MREELKLIVEVGGTWENDLNQLIVKLGEVQTVAEAVEDITIDVDVRDGELDALLAKMSAAEMGQTVSIGDGSRTGSVPPPYMAMGGTNVDIGRQFHKQRQQIGALIEKLDGDFASLSKSMGNTMSAADKAADSFELSNLRMSDLHNAVARLIPLIFVFVGALPALIAGVVSLAAAAFSAAAALGAITAFGALGLTLTTNLDITEEIRQDFLDAFTPLATDLAPLFRDGLDGLERFFDALAQRGDVLRDFADDARGFGAFLLDYLPDAIANMGRLADASSEMFGVIGEGLQDISFTDAFANFLAEALPTLLAFSRALVDFIPTLVNVSIGFLDMVNAIMWAIGAFGWLLSLLGINEQALGAMIAVLLTATSAYLIFSSAILKGAAAALVTLGTRLLAAISTLTSFSASAIVSTAATYGLSSAVLALAGAIGVLLAVSGIGLLIPLLGGIASKFLGIDKNIKSATDSLKEFRDVGRRMNRDNPYGPDPDIEDELKQYRGGSGRGESSTSVEVRDAEQFDTKIKNQDFREWSNAQ